MITSVQQGTTAIRVFETLTRVDGERAAPSATPTVVSIHVDGVFNSALAAAATITQMQDGTPANIPGYYRLEFPTTSLAVNNDIHVTLAATINGFPRQTVYSFVIIDQPSMLPVIR